MGQKGSSEVDKHAKVHIVLNETRSYPGARISGYLKIVASKKTKLDQIRLKLSGNMNVRVGKDRLVKELVSEEVHLTRYENDNGYVAAGNHQIPFSFRIPENAACTFDFSHNLLADGSMCNLSYSVSAFIGSASWLSKDTPVDQVYFLVTHNTDLVKELVIENTTVLDYGFQWFAPSQTFGPVNVNIVLGRDKYRAGDTIDGIKVYVNNQSNADIEIKKINLRDRIWLKSNRKTAEICTNSWRLEPLGQVDSSGSFGPNTAFQQFSYFGKSGTETVRKFSLTLPMNIEHQSIQGNNNVSVTYNLEFTFSPQTFLGSNYKVIVPLTLSRYVLEENNTNSNYVVQQQAIDEQLYEDSIPYAIPAEEGIMMAESVEAIATSASAAQVMAATGHLERETTTTILHEKIGDNNNDDDNQGDAKRVSS